MGSIARESEAQARADAYEALAERPRRVQLAKMVTRLFEHWGLSTRDQCHMLGLNPNARATLSRYRNGEPVAPSRDMVERVGHLLSIHKSLRILYPRNRDLVYRWMTWPNEVFGMTPAEYVKRYGFEGLVAVRRHLDYRRGR